MSPHVPAPPAEAAPPAPPWPGLDSQQVPDLDTLVTQDDTPVDSIFAEKQARLLAGTLNDSWSGPGPGRPFLSLSDVGLFHTVGEPPLVPDALLSLDVAVGPDLSRKENHSYFVWRLGKPPDVVIEIVSDRRGGEIGFKENTYARIQVPYYVIFDPNDQLGGGVLRVCALRRGRYKVQEPGWLAKVGLGLMLWTGPFEQREQTWLRWCDAEGRPIPTGAERADEERRRADEERRRADEERRRADEERQRADEEKRRADEERRRAEQNAEKVRLLEAQLRALGTNPRT